MTEIDFIINFANVSVGNVLIQNHSTACVIEITVDNPDNEKPTTLWLEYYELRNLMSALNQITKQ